jgi:hypothetical protein
MPEYFMQMKLRGSAVSLEIICMNYMHICDSAIRNLCETSVEFLYAILPF